MNPEEVLRAVVAMLLPFIRPIVAQAVEETHRQREADEAKLGNDRLGHTEAESAALIGVAQHVLRDARRRGEISARLVGKKYIYARSEILRFLADH